MTHIIWTIRFIIWTIWTIRFIIWTISHMDHMDHKVNKLYIIRDYKRMDHKKRMDHNVLFTLWTIKMLGYMDHKKYGP